ncbi:MAG: hypothetical protein V3R43_01090 [bacterium]
MRRLSLNIQECIDWVFEPIGLLDLLQLCLDCLVGSCVCPPGLHDFLV